MEEFIERVSDIAGSPVIHKRWQRKYRQLFNFSLVLFLLLSFSALSTAQENKVSRLEFLTLVFERVYNRHLTEMDAVNSGLLDFFDDGSYHLDWPVSRGMTAEAFFRLSLQSGTAAKLPRAFADIGADSSFRQPLKVVGGAFLPLRKGNFDPNYLIDRKGIIHALKVLIDKGVLKQEDRSDMPIVRFADPFVSTSQNDNPDSLSPVKPELGFSQKPATSNLYRASTYKRLADADAMVTSGQINPQMMSSIEDASNAMADVEIIVTRLGGNVMEMTSTYPSNPDDERLLRVGLSEIESVLDAVVKRFEYSQLQLSTVVPVDPDQIKLCDNLNNKFDELNRQIKTLRQRIASRLAEPGDKHD